MTTSDLASRSCADITDDTRALDAGKVDALLAQLGNDWKVNKDHHLTKTYTFDDWAGALAFVNRVSEVAERENHHPVVYLSWGIVRLDIWTHRCNGLTENDFILAAKADAKL